MLTGGLPAACVLNPDIENPDIENPDIENTEIYNPDIENPDIENPDIENPDIENPDIENPDIENIVVANPDIENVGIGNPDIENPDIENPDIENPDIENPDIENGAISDVTWTVSNTGNTTSAFNVNMFLASTVVPPPCGTTSPAGCADTKLILYKTYATPVLGAGASTDLARFCNVGTETRNVLIANIANPVFITQGVELPDQNSASDKNATLWLAPGELARITLRIYDPNRSDNVRYQKADGTFVSVDRRFDPATKLTPGVAAQAIDQGLNAQDPPGAIDPPIITPNGTNMDYLQQPTDAEPGAPIAPVSVRVWENSGDPATDVSVTVFLTDAAGVVVPGGLGGTTTAVTGGPMDPNPGVATFTGLSVAVPGTYRLLALATSGVTASGLSSVFVIAAPPNYTTWSASGDGTATLLNNGSTGTPAFHYLYNGTPGAWGFSTVATATGTVNLTYAWNGFHSYFMVATGLEVFVNRAGTDVSVVTLASDGPYVCCVPPSGGFGYAGATSVAVQAGDTYGFRLRGSQSDSANTLQGTLSVAVGGTPQFAVNVRGTAGGTELDSYATPQAIRVFGGTLATGQQVTVTATGLVQRGVAFAPNGPNGDGIACPGSCLAPGLSSLALVARIGGGPWQFVGSGPTVLTATSPGLLEFAVNDNAFTDNTGGFVVNVSWTP